MSSIRQRFATEGMPVRRLQLAFAALALLIGAVPCVATEDAKPKIYVVLWFDTEDYLLPASDDAALHLADFLSGEKIRATFKIVGEKARVLERRKRYDVIEALKRHEIGYHSNFHSVQPSPAMYLSDLGWTDGVAEFERREGAGRQDVERIFGRPPVCYGQPGSSWAPQSFGAMRNWKMPVYLDAGRHVGLNGQPHYYCGILTLYHLTHTLRTGLGGEAELRAAEDQFQTARQKLLAAGGGLVSIYYHPCEFVHQQFWDGVNFSRGANPPRDAWRLPPQKTAEQSRIAYQTFEGYIRFIRGFNDVEFITATEAALLYRDRAQGRKFSTGDLKRIAAAATDGATFQQGDDYALSASEIFWLLNEYVTAAVRGEPPSAIELKRSPLGPAGSSKALEGKVLADRSQFVRTAVDVANSLAREGRLPTTVWLGSQAVPPESYLPALAHAASLLLDGKLLPDTIEFHPGRLTTSAYAAEDGPLLWGWVIFPPGFRAPAMMELARLQTWTIKPALLAAPAVASSQH